MFCRFSRTLACDGQTDRQTDRRTDTGPWLVPRIGSEIPVNSRMAINAISLELLKSKTFKIREVYFRLSPFHKYTPSPSQSNRGGSQKRGYVLKVSLCLALNIADKIVDGGRCRLFAG